MPTGAISAGTDIYAQLWAAVAQVHEAIVKELLNTSNIDLNSSDNKGMTPLAEAVSKGHMEAAKLLLDKGAKNAM